MQAEFAIIVRSDLKGQGLGSMLMRKLIDYCRNRGTHELVGEALSHNVGVLQLVRKLGFEVAPIPGDERTMRLHLDLGGKAG